MTFQWVVHVIDGMDFEENEIIKPSVQALKPLFREDLGLHIFFSDSLLFGIYFSLSTSSQLTFQWVVHVIDGMDYRGQTREELSWTCL